MLLDKIQCLETVPFNNINRRVVKSVWGTLFFKQELNFVGVKSSETKQIKCYFYCTVRMKRKLIEYNSISMLEEFHTKGFTLI
jgi:hypothetical protein